MRIIRLDGLQRCRCAGPSQVADRLPSSAKKKNRGYVMTAAIDDVTEAMKDVVDPELGINVVDLGLIYDVMVDENNIAILNMTLTSAACPLQDVIEDQTRQALAPLTSDVKINWVWMPPWGPDKISDDGRDQLRALGFTV